MFCAESKSIHSSESNIKLCPQITNWHVIHLSSVIYTFLHEHTIPLTVQVCQEVHLDVSPAVSGLVWSHFLLVAVKKTKHVISTMSSCVYSALNDAHTWLHIHTHTHAHMKTYTHTHTQIARTHTHTHTHMHTYTIARTHTWTYIHCHTANLTISVPLFSTCRPISLHRDAHFWIFASLVAEVCRFDQYYHHQQLPIFLDYHMNCPLCVCMNPPRK